ncbi:MAG: PQQ-binding-like beta-propeller repeat protein, partial [Deltaproteobacteria bacterium]|nr:PQQ-binding-like beta-propeller repeat protein [Deltaproteobacteria bacterium]
WRAEVGAAAGIAVGVRVLYLAGADGSVMALRRDNGAVVWRVRPGEGIATAPVLASGAVVVGFSDGPIVTLDPATGAVQGRYVPGPGLHGQPVVLDGAVVFLSDGSALHVLGPD